MFDGSRESEVRAARANVNFPHFLPVDETPLSSDDTQSGCNRHHRFSPPLYTCFAPRAKSAIRLRRRERTGGSIGKLAPLRRIRASNVKNGRGCFSLITRFPPCFPAGSRARSNPRARRRRVSHLAASVRISTLFLSLILSLDVIYTMMIRDRLLDRRYIRRSVGLAAPEGTKSFVFSGLRQTKCARTTGLPGAGR